MLELELNGYTVVPPEVTGVTEVEVDELTDLLLKKSEALVGCEFTIEVGEAAELDFGNYPGTLELIYGAKQSQFQLMQLCTFDRASRNLAVNPVSNVLMRHLIGWNEARFSSHNCFIKWQGDGYGELLGLHCDQGGVPMPLGSHSLTANCNWCLTEYTPDNEAFACVPGSHLRHSHPVLPAAVSEAIPVDCSKGL